MSKWFSFHRFSFSAWNELHCEGMYPCFLATSFFLSFFFFVLCFFRLIFNVLAFDVNLFVRAAHFVLPNFRRIRSCLFDSLFLTFFPFYFSGVLQSFMAAVRISLGIQVIKTKPKDASGNSKTMTLSLWFRRSTDSFLENRCFIHLVENWSMYWVVHS